MAREKPNTWWCGHNYPILVESVQGGKRARCLGCEHAGPVQPDAQEAMRALRDEARFLGRAGA